MNYDGSVQTRGSISVAPLDKEGNLLMDEVFECTDCDPAPFVISGAGPEFAHSGGETFLYFTAMSEDQTTVRLAKLHYNKMDGYNKMGWDLSFLPNTDGKVMSDPEGTPTETNPKVSYRRIEGSFRDVASGILVNRFHQDFSGWRYDEWRDDDKDPVDTIVEPPSFVKGVRGFEGSVFVGRWFPEDARMAHVWVAPQTFLDKLLKRIRTVPAVYNGDTDIVTPLYLSSGVPAELTQVPKALIRWPVVFSAPELGGSTAVITVVDSAQGKGTDILVWREDPPGTWDQWARIPAVSLDPDYPCLIHPEGFAVNDKSYIVVEAHRQLSCDIKSIPVPTPSKIWVLTVDPTLQASEQVRRIVSTERDPARVSIKGEPEAIVLADKKVRIYYDDSKSITFKDAVLTVCDPGL